MTSYDVVTAASDADLDELWQVYDPVFGDRDRGEWAEGMARQASRDGFRLARARTEAGLLVGFSHGHTGERGQWWTDRVAEVLPPDVARTWVGGHFELIELAVLPGHRGRGIARRLMGLVTADLPHDRWLLSTSADPDDPARHLYASLGWSVLGSFSPEVVVMGRRRG
jgi:ribosomal protein S18 acetylase RimI-like enzyme